MIESNSGALQRALILVAGHRDMFGCPLEGRVYFVTNHSQVYGGNPRLSAMWVYTSHFGVSKQLKEKFDAKLVAQLWALQEVDAVDSHDPHVALAIIAGISDSLVKANQLIRSPLPEFQKRVKENIDRLDELFTQLRRLEGNTAVRKRIEAPLKEAFFYKWRLQQSLDVASSERR